MKRKPMKFSHKVKSGKAPHAKEKGFDASWGRAKQEKRIGMSKPPHKSGVKTGTTRKKGMESEDSKSAGRTGDLGAGHHKLAALQKHSGIVKKKTAKKLESIEKWIKRRNYGELAKKGH